MRRVCAQCRVANRIPVRHLADTGTCGKCRAVLPPHATPIEVTSTEMFDEIITGVRVPVLVDFWATWCVPCRGLVPEVKKAARNLAGKALVLRVDTDALEELAQRYHVQGVPNFGVFTGGRLVHLEAEAADHGALEKLANATQ